MSKANKKIEELRAAGHRLTAIRRAMIEIFLATELPLSASEVLERLKHRDLAVNKTTVYRELEFLLKERLIREIDLLEGMKRYESIDFEGAHHHHLVCINCKSIRCVHMEKDLDQLERKLEKKHNFKVLSHTLEFFGLCRKCAAEHPQTSS